MVKDKEEKGQGQGPMGMKVGGQTQWNQAVNQQKKESVSKNGETILPLAAGRNETGWARGTGNGQRNAPGCHGARSNGKERQALSVN
jgi:hypothetical protein